MFGTEVAILCAWVAPKTAKKHNNKPPDRILTPRGPAIRSMRSIKTILRSGSRMHLKSPDRLKHKTVECRYVVYRNDIPVG